MIGRIAAAALAAGLAAAAAPAAPLAVDLGGQARFAVTVASMAERRFASVFRQRLDFSCGSAALATLLHYHYGLPVDEQAVLTGMWATGDQAQIRRLGFSLLDMKRLLARRGIAADGYRVGLDQIAAAGLPGIVLARVRGYDHFVVLKAVAADAVLLGDPSLGLRWERRDRFLRQWNGIFFALPTGPRAALAAQAQADAALAPRVRLGAAAPLDLAGLRLVRPATGGW